MAHPVTDFRARPATTLTALRVHTGPGRNRAGCAAGLIGSVQLLSLITDVGHGRTQRLERRRRITADQNQVLLSQFVEGPFRGAFLILWRRQLRVWRSTRG